MFPTVRFLGVDLYFWMIIIGVVAAMVYFRFVSEKIKVSSKLHNLTVITAIGGVVVGYLASILAQDFYSFIKTGEWVSSTGSTFLGGLIGGLAFFHLLYFLCGKFVLKTDEHIKEYNTIISVVIPAIVLAHAFGRIGCLFAGCCYGKLTDAWYGISVYVHGVLEKRIPTQLIESIFLFLLCAVLTYLLIKKNNRHTVSIYMISYGIFRFLIEFIRDDERGSLGSTIFSPSQLISMAMIVGGVILLILYYTVFNPKKETITNEEE